LRRDASDLGIGVPRLTEAVEAGLVERIQNPNDRRSVIAKLTDRGRDRLRNYIDRVQWAFSAAAGPSTPNL
jgi:DNA-binding MarR family transcriptional regulator